MGDAATGLNEQEFIVLNAVHLKRMADDAQLAALTGLATETFVPLLTDCANRELVMSMDSGHMLLPAGTEAVRAHYDRIYGALRGDPDIDGWYARFETLNTRFIKLLTNWQENADDAALFAALEVVEQLCTALDPLLSAIPRYADYQRRFLAATDAIDDGDTDLLCNPRRDSAHNIWFEFHEDILSVLGRPRETT